MLIAYAQKKEVSDFLVIGYLYFELNLNFIYVTSFKFYFACLCSEIMYQAYQLFFSFVKSIITKF